MNLHLRLFSFAILLTFGFSGCATKSSAKAELKALQQDAFQKASVAAKDYATCAALTAVIESKSIQSRTEAVDIAQAQCRPKLDEYEMHMGNYFIALSPTGYSEKARQAATGLRSSNRDSVLRILSQQP